QESMFPHRLEYNAKDLLINLWPQPVPNHAQTAVLRRTFLQPISQKATDRKRVLAARRNSSLTRQVLKKSHHQHREIHHRITPRPASLTSVTISHLACLPHLPREIHFQKRLIQLGVKPRCARPLNRSPWNPKFVLLFPFRSSFEHASPSTKLNPEFGGFSTVC